MAESSQATAGQLDNQRQKLQPNIGAFIGLVRGNKILLRQCTNGEEASITGKNYTGQWELPGGAADPVGDKKTDYYYVLREALRELDEETGIFMDLDDAMNFHGLPLFFNAKAGPDLAIVYPICATDEEDEVEKTEHIRWVDFEELQQMARDDKIVGGYGKRQHIMALHSLFEEAENDNVSEAAQAAIEEINKKIFTKV